MLGGFDTLIYSFELRDAPPALAGPLVLRLYRDARGPERARREGSVQNAVAALGFPTPRVLLTCVDRAVLGGAFVVMPRLPGRVMLDAFLGPRVVRMPALLAALQARLHALDPDALARALEAAACPVQSMTVAAELGVMEAQIDAARLSGLAAGMQWVLANRPRSPARPAICHGDFHPLNVLLDGRHVSGVLDWARAKIDDPAWDVGATVALVTQGPLDLPGVLLGVAGAARRWLIARYVRAYAALRPLDLAAVRYYEALRCLGMLIEGGEHRQVQRGVIAPIAKPTAFDTPRAVHSLVTRFGALSGVAVALPGPEEPRSRS
jgi:aminoglycoside phosphotransferase (APT) family kinase protein